LFAKVASKGEMRGGVHPLQAIFCFFGGFVFFNRKARGGDAEKTEPCTQPIFDGWARRECIYAFPASTPQAFNVCRKN